MFPEAGGRGNEEDGLVEHPFPMVGLDGRIELDHGVYLSSMSSCVSVYVEYVE